MDIMGKPVVVVSKCLEFAHCRWNGSMISSPVVKLMEPLVHFIPVCPEVETGLGAPRDPIRVIVQKGEKSLVQPSTGRDVTKPMKDFAGSFLGSLDVVDGFILKEKSPSCGTRKVKIYPGPGDVPLSGRGRGFFGAAVWEKFSHLPIEDEDRLNNSWIREHFFTRLYAVSRFRELKKSPSSHRLVQFQAKNKYMFLAYNREQVRIMERLAANPGKKPLTQVLEEYGRHFYRVFAGMPAHASHIDVLERALGRVSKKISEKERQFFLDLLRRCREGKQPLSVPLGVMKSWILRFDVQYLQDQTYFDPFPEQLLGLSDPAQGTTG